jgi:glycosyltransferase involved in cell wall biosynthesis
MVASCTYPLLLGGVGPPRAELEARAGENVGFVGQFPPAELATLRAQAAVAVVPSRYAEILPLAALEAMAAGLPTVAAASGGLVEAVPQEGQYPPGDTQALAARLQALWRNAAAGERALQAARAISSPAEIGSRLTAIYEGRNFDPPARL